MMITITIITNVSIIVIIIIITVIIIINIITIITILSIDNQWPFPPPARNNMMLDCRNGNPTARPSLTGLMGSLGEMSGEKLVQVG